MLIIHLLDVLVALVILTVANIVNMVTLQPIPELEIYVIVLAMQMLLLV
jgi:hypothetical protein